MSSRRRAALRADRAGLRGTGTEVGFSAADLQGQKLKRQQWLKEEQVSRENIRLEVEKKNKDQADSALKMMLFIWMLIVLFIFYFVLSTISFGKDALAKRGGTSSESLLRAFRENAGKF